MIHIVLFRPEIPQNTGNIGRLCACTYTRLHLIHPLGFSLSERYIRRSGMDYWRYLDLREYANWEEFWQSQDRPQRIWLLTTHADQLYTDVAFKDGDGLLFGSEGAGCADFGHEALKGTRITIPMPNKEARSLNLATSVGIVRYEVLRQCGE